MLLNGRRMVNMETLQKESSTQFRPWPGNGWTSTLSMCKFMLVLDSQSIRNLNLLYMAVLWQFFAEDARVKLHSIYPKYHID